MWLYSASSCLSVRSYITVITTSFPLKDLLKCSKQKMREDVCCPKSQRRFAKINQPGAHKNLCFHSSQIESSVHWFQKALSKQNTYSSLKYTNRQIWVILYQSYMSVSDRKKTPKNKNLQFKLILEYSHFHIFLYQSHLSLYGNNALSEDNAYDNVLSEKSKIMYLSPSTTYGSKKYIQVNKN